MNQGCGDQFLKRRAVVLDFLSKKHLVFRSAVTMGVQLNINAVSRNFLQLAVIHQLQNSLRFQLGVVNLQNAG